MRRRNFLWLGAAATGAAALGSRMAYASADIRLDPATRFQTMRGWETTLEVFWTEDFSPFRAEIYDRLITEVGITRLRLEVWSGAENTDRSFENFQSGAIDIQGWRDRRYSTVNDDDDPFHINWAGFDFANLDWRVEQHLLPILERARVHGQKMEINFTYVAFTKQIKIGEYVHTNPEEYAEFILASFLHLRDKYGIVPDSFEPILEPDNVPQWNPQLFGQAVAAATRRLDHAGFHPRVVLPSVTDIHKLIPWMKEIIKVPGAMDGVRELSYHRYHGGEIALLQKIAALAKTLGLETAMLEYWGGKGVYPLLHNDLKYADVTVWQGRSALSHHHIDTSRPAGQQLVLNEDVRFDRLYYAAIRPGAVRIGAATSNAKAADPVAFVTPEGGMAVVLRLDKAASVAVHDLPAGDYLLETAYGGGGTTAPVSFHADGAQPFVTDLPGPGVISIRPDRR